MKKTAILLLFITTIVAISCNKNECHECHYDINGTEVELGEYCGNDLSDIEANGYTDSTGTVHTVHCHEH